jgi:uncharacterized protein YgfB (UPF0149 family)
MSANQPVGHAELDEALARLRLGTSASELHGSMCGFISGGGLFGSGSILAVLEVEAPSASLDADDEALLKRLRRQCEEELDNTDLSFQPMLPDDGEPLPERAEALGDWCRGFLGGFGLAGSAAQAGLSDDAREVLRDMANIASTEFDFGDDAEDEDALIEVVEFVRVGALLLHAELHSAQKPASGTLH